MVQCNVTPKKRAARSRKTVRRDPFRHLIVPRTTAAVIALMQIGLTDYSSIAAAAGVSEDEVQRIDRAEDPLVRQLSIEGVPNGVYFHLRKRIRCPKCAGWITIAPCVACNIRKERATNKEQRIGVTTNQSGSE